MDAPAVAVSADGKTIAVAWMDMRRGPSERDAWWRIIRNGKPGREMALADDQEGIQGHTALAIDKEDVVHAAWVSRGSIFYRNSGNGEIVKVSGERGATQPSLAVNGDVVVVAYEVRKKAFVRRVK